MGDGGGAALVRAVSARQLRLRSLQLGWNSLGRHTAAALQEGLAGGLRCQRLGLAHTALDDLCGALLLEQLRANGGHGRALREVHAACCVPLPMCATGGHAMCTAC